MDPLVSHIEHLICDLYSDQKQSDQKEINKFNETNSLLIDLQKSKEAWMFSWMLMNREKPVNVQYYGASSLYLKLTKFHFELDAESHSQLRLKIIENLFNYMQHPEFNSITNKLISCLAVYIVQSVSTTWSTALQDIVNFFQPEQLSHIPPTRVIQVLLEILSVIPDELNNPYNDRLKKMAARFELIKHVGSVLSFVYKVFSEDNISDNITKVCLKCFSSWSVGLDSLVISEQHSNIMSLVLNCVCNENTCHEAVESIVNVYTSPHMTSKQPKLILGLIEQITIALRDVINRAIQESNHDFLRDLYFLFVSIGECHARVILDSLKIPEQSLKTEIIVEFFNVFLKCSSTPTYYGYDETISDMPFNFWITFQDELMSLDESNIQIHLSIFRDIFHSMVNIYLIKSQYPPEEIYSQIWDKDDREKFRCYRQDIADTFAYCFTILNVSLLQILINHYNKALAQTKELNLNSMPSSIRYLESVIYAFSSLMEHIAISENVYMPQILNSLQTLPMDCFNDPRLLATLNCFLSNSAEWLSNNIIYVAPALTIISISLKSTDLLVIISATMALKIITFECQLNLGAYAQQILSICEEFLGYPNLQYKEKARLMHSLGTVLSIMPLDLIMQTIDRILVPILTETEKILCVDDNNNNQDARLHINGVLMMLSNLFAKLDVNLKQTELEDGDQMISKKAMQSKAKNKDPQPLFLIVEKVLPMFGVIAVNYASEEEIAQNLCECIKKTVITLLDDIKPLIGNILQLLLHLYNNSKSSAVIKISRLLFTLFHKEDELLPGLQEFFYSITSITMEEFRKDFRESTFLAQDFFEECAHALRKSTVIFLCPKLDLLTIFDYALAGILLPEKGTIHQCSIFISEFLNQGRNNEHFHKVIDERFEILVMKIFIVIGGSQGSPSYSVDFMSDIIIALKQKYSDSFTRTLDAVVNCDGFPTGIITREQKTNFVQAISLLRNNNKRKLKEVIKEFSSRCRGLFGIDKGN